jgi:glucose/arabinose dehydrogenase
MTTPRGFLWWWTSARLAGTCLALWMTVSSVWWAEVPRAFAAVSLPTEFSDAIVADGFDRAIDLALLPDGRMLLAEQKSGRVMVLLETGTQGSTDALVVPGLETAHNEAGLLAIAIDPQWPARPYLYTWFTAAASNDCRIVRFTGSGALDDPLSTSLTFDPSSAVEILVGVRDDAGNHNGGTLLFGTDGMLYVSIGDDESRCSAQDVNSLLGKVLRLRVDQIGPAGPVPQTEIAPTDNPFFAQGGVAALVWAYGLRNPFRMTRDSETGTLFIGDVGQSTREQVSHVESGGVNLGWPFREGTFLFTTTGCTEPPDFDSLAPIVDYGRSEGASVVAGFVYRPPGTATAAWPQRYHGNFFYIDFYRVQLRRLVGTGQNWMVGAEVPGQPEPGAWASGIGAAVDFEVGPDGSVLWVSLYSTAGSEATGGSVHRITYTGQGTGVESDEVRSIGSFKSRYR